MGASFGGLVGTLVALGLLVSACGNARHGGGTVAALCEPGQKSCDGQNVQVCSVDGSQLSTAQTCSATQTCVDGACTGSQGPIAAGGAPPCSADCQGDSVCSAGRRLCQDGDVYLCAGDGTSASLLIKCLVGQSCDGDKLACVDKVCDPDSIGCDGTRVATCNSDGTGWKASGTDCATSKQSCVDGACQKQMCKPKATFCQGIDAVFQCDATGVTSSLSQKCLEGYHCAPSLLDSAICEVNQCQPGDPSICVGHQVRVCNADLSMAPSGSDCRANEYCADGSCHAPGCQPDEHFCLGRDVYYCDDSQGWHASLWRSCPTDTTCNLTGNLFCVGLPCSPGVTDCIDNKIGTCADDGASLSAVDTDCGQTNTICGSDNQCATSVVDELGADETTQDEGDGWLLGDIVQVSSSRTLTQMQIHLDLPTSRTLRWVVFEQTAALSLVAKKDWIVDEQGGTGFVSSPALSFALKAGKTYLFGVVVTGGVPGSTTAVLDKAPFASGVSFGTLLGRVDASYQSPLDGYGDTEFIYQMKLTTAAP